MRGKFPLSRLPIFPVTTWGRRDFHSWKLNAREFIFRLFSPGAKAFLLNLGHFKILFFHPQHTKWHENGWEKWMDEAHQTQKRAKWKGCLWKWKDAEKCALKICHKDWQIYRLVLRIILSVYLLIQFIFSFTPLQSYYFISRDRNRVLPKVKQYDTTMKPTAPKQTTKQHNIRELNIIFIKQPLEAN